MFTNKYVKSLRPYQLVSHRAWEELEQGNEVLKLDWNESVIAPSPEVKMAITKFLNNGKLNWYPDVNNNSLRKAIAQYNQLEEGCIEYFPSSDALHEYTLRTYVEPEDVIIIVAPTYDNFRAVAESYGAHIHYFYLTDDDFSFNLADFIQYLEKVRPKIVYLCNPNNPTGTQFEYRTLEFLISTYDKILFIVDEAYYEFTGLTIKHLVSSSENLIISRTFSKAFGLAGFRIGYCIASVSIINQINKVRNPKNISTLTQVAAIAALADIPYMMNYVRLVESAKKEFVRKLETLSDTKIRVFSGGGNFVLVHFLNNKGMSIANYLEKKNIFLRSFSHIFKENEFVRITIGTPEQMDRVFMEIYHFLCNQDDVS